MFFKTEFGKCQSRLRHDSEKGRADGRVLVHDKMYLSISNYGSYFQWKIENFLHFNLTELLLIPLRIINLLEDFGLSIMLTP